MMRPRMAASVPDEPLELSAPLAWRLAPALCRRDPATGEDCSWYHGAWQFLRRMDLVDAPGLDAAFISEAAASACAGGPAPRVLVSGAADYSILAHALAAFRRGRVEPSLTVVDSCATPLYLNRWYAARVACCIETAACDIFDYASPEPFDVLVAHSFFVHVGAQRRAALVARWHGLLRSGATVIAASRIWPDSSDGQDAYSEAQVAAFRDAALRRAAALADARGPAVGELASMAEAYARRRRLHRVRSAEELAGLLERGGFRIDRLDRPEGSMPARAGIDGRGAARARARIVATRL